MLTLAQPALAQGFGSFLRSLSNSLSSGSEKPASNSSATVGIRGMDEETATAGPPASEDVKIADGWAASKLEAESAAKKRGLVANAHATFTRNESPEPSGETQ